MNDNAKNVKKLILQFRDGNEKAYDELSALYSPMLTSMASKYFAMRSEEDGSDYQDMYQEASIAFYRSAVTFDVENTSVSFGLYAKICVRNALVSALRRSKRSSKHSRDVSAKDSHTADPVSGVIAEEAKKNILDSSGKILSSYELQVLREYMEGRKVREIAEKLGKSSKSVSNALFRCRAKLETGMKK
jgi:RNA polymerase sporulation-specific sigma factor